MFHLVLTDNRISSDFSFLGILLCARRQRCRSHLFSTMQKGSASQDTTRLFPRARPNSTVPLDSNRSGPNQFHHYTSRCCDCWQAFEKEIGSLKIGTYPYSKTKSAPFILVYWFLVNLHTWNSLFTTLCYSWMNRSNQDPSLLPISIWRNSPWMHWKPPGSTIHVRMWFKMEFDLTNHDKGEGARSGNEINVAVVCRDVWTYHDEHGSCPVSLNNTESLNVWNTEPALYSTWRPNVVTDNRYPSYNYSKLYYTGQIDSSYKMLGILQMVFLNFWKLCKWSNTIWVSWATRRSEEL